MEKIITPEMKQEAETIYKEYQTGFNYSANKRKSHIDENNFYFDINRQSDAINAVIAFVCAIDGEFDVLAYLLGKKLKDETNEAEIREALRFFATVANLVSYKEELFILQDTLERKAKLIRDIDMNNSMSEILKG